MDSTLAMCLYSTAFIFLYFSTPKYKCPGADPISAPEVSYYINITFRKSPRPYFPNTPYWRYWEFLRVGGLSKLKKEEKKFPEECCRCVKSINVRREQESNIQLATCDFQKSFQFYNKVKCTINHWYKTDFLFWWKWSTFPYINQDFCSACLP